MFDFTHVIGPTSKSSNGGNWYDLEPGLANGQPGSHVNSD